MYIINDSLEEELKERLEIAGIEVLEARIGYLAYAPEIAGAMLKRQQATAIVAARFKIVEGAVGMVETALEQLSKKDIITLDEDKKATMVSNLMVVLCGDRDASPVINTGTLSQ
jgi:regulator of protease activity HflC (stomatin/prohibitin superfamily)